MHGKFGPEALLGDVRRKQLDDCRLVKSRLPYGRQAEVFEPRDMAAFLLAPM
jgi:hypothetical protein